MTERWSHESELRAVRESLLDAGSLLGCGAKDGALEAIKEALARVNVLIATIPAPVGRVSAPVHGSTEGEPQRAIGAGPGVVEYEQITRAIRENCAAFANPPPARDTSPGVELVKLVITRDDVTREGKES